MRQAHKKQKPAMRNGACARGSGFAFEFLNRAAARFILRFRNARSTGSGQLPLGLTPRRRVTPIQSVRILREPVFPWRD